MVLAVGLHGHGQPRHAEAGAFQRGADRARDGDAAADVLTVVDAGHDQVGVGGHKLHQAMLHRLRGGAGHGVDLPRLPVDGHGLEIDAAFGVVGHAAAGAAPLVERRHHGHIAQWRQRRRRGPQAGGADAVVVRQ